jgi:hypothetical protein
VQRGGMGGGRWHGCRGGVGHVVQDRRRHWRAAALGRLVRLSDWGKEKKSQKESLAV